MSDQERRADAARLLGSLPKKRHPSRCERCGQDMEAVGRQRFCSTNCRVLAHREAKKLTEQQVRTP